MRKLFPHVSARLALTLTQTAVCCGLFDCHFWETAQFMRPGLVGISSPRRILPPDQSSTFGRHFSFQLPIAPITPRGNHHYITKRGQNEPANEQSYQSKNTKDKKKEDKQKK